MPWLSSSFLLTKRRSLKLIYLLKALKRNNLVCADPQPGPGCGGRRGKQTTGVLEAVVFRIRCIPVCLGRLHTGFPVRDCLRRIMRYGLAGGSLSLKVGFEISKDLGHSQCALSFLFAVWRCEPSTVPAAMPLLLHHDSNPLEP